MRVLVAIPLLLLASTAGAQTFTRLTDPASPIVADHHLSCGVSFVDLVGDGFLDLFVANGNVSNDNNALYRNLRPGGFVRVVTGPVVNDGGPSIGGTIGDYDNDGFPDLFVPNRNSFGNFLYRGLGDTLFARVSAGPGIDAANSNSASWVDLDRDGALDLYVVNFQANDFLYRASGAPGYGFARVDTTAATPGAEFSIPGAWGDVNGDGWDDLFIGNAGAQNDYLYMNHGGLFFTRTVIPDGLSTLGASWGDYDNDGNLDLVVAHYSGQSCTLYHNGGPPTFTLTPVASPVSTPAGFWVGTAWGDYDNDGALDLFVAYDGAAGALYHNDGPPAYTFTRVTSGPIASDPGSAFGAAWGDYDRDGQLDLFVTDRTGGGNRLYHNGGTANHWLGVRCAGTVSNRSGIGARVRVRATISGSPRWQVREVTAQTGYNSGNLDQHFGLGDAAAADSLIVDWPSGHRDTWANVPVDRFTILTEGTGTVSVPDERPLAPLTLLAPSPNPCRDRTAVEFRLARDTDVRLECFDVRGRRVATALAGRQSAGRHVASLALPEGTGAGLYWLRLTDGETAAVRRLTILK